MEDIVIGIGEKFLECLVGPIVDHSRYLFCFKKFIRDLKEAKDELKARLEEVKERIEQVARNGEEIMLPVKNWLDDVEKILKDEQELQQRVEVEGKSCFNVSHRYSLAKQMDGKAKRMIQLKKGSHFEKDHFSCLAPIPGITYFSSKDFVDFNSRKSTSNHLLEAVKDEKNKMIGLYGMGGSGKTTLAKEVGKKVHDLKLFEKVVLVVVSKPPNVAKLQQEIAEQIDLKFQEETQFARAQRLSERLKNKKILIILDDLWEHLNLEDIGIPLVEGCHILLTTRLRNVCISMDCVNVIELPLITKEEAWDLFKKHANIYNDHSNMFDDVGRKIVNECKELPIAIVVVGSSLKGKPIVVWESALQRLKHFQPLNVEQGFRSPYACLELSYDSLPSPTAKSLFLLCSMFPEDHEIHKEDLIRFGNKILELDESIDTMEYARREVLVALNILLDSCLLMSIDNQTCVKMHDLVRDVALWIANKQRQAIVVVSNNQSLKDTKAVSLWNLDENFKLSNQLCCPNLDVLLLHPHGSIEEFAGMKALKVLALISSSFDWTPWSLGIDCSILQSIVSLTNLHTLCLRGKKLGDISFLGELKGLEVLDLHGSLFNELPAGIVNMKMLKLLDIFACEIKKCPLEVIGKCEQLEELYIWNDNSTIPESLSLPPLKRYVISDSICPDHSYRFNNLFLQDLESLDHSNEEIRMLCIQGFRIFALNSSMKNLIYRANCLWLNNCLWDHNVDADIPQTQKVFSHLITLRLIDMNSLEQVFQDSCISFSPPMLQDLFIKNCPKLGTCIFTHSMITSPPKLRRLEIEDCDKVKWLFSYSLASHCPSLEEIYITNCFLLEGLIDERATHGDPLLHDMQNDPYQPLILFPKLKKIVIYECNKVRCPLPYSLASHFPSLERLSIEDCYELERLVDGESDEVAAHGNQQLLKLKVLILRYLPKLRVVFGYEYKLESLHDKEESQQQNKHQNERVNLHMVNSELQSIELRDLPKLEYIWQGPAQIVSLHKLAYVFLSKCLRLRNIFTLATVTSLPELRSLHVSRCKEWEGIFCEESLKNLSASIVCFPKLEKIYIYGCHKVRRLFSYSLAFHCPSLERIAIHDCYLLEGVVQAYEGEVVSHDKKLFPKLDDLNLRRLPKLREIYTDYEFIHLSGTIDIRNCPNICKIPLEYKASSSDQTSKLENKGGMMSLDLLMISLSAVVCKDVSDLCK